MQATAETLREKLSRVNRELAAAGRRDEFYTSLENAWNRYGSLTERQEAALVRSFARADERAATRATENAAIQSPMPQGRVTISGEILSTKWQDNRFGGAWKMLVRSDAGWKVYGTIPAGISSGTEFSVRFEELAGNRVTFTATIEPKEPAFGFFSRPTNATVKPSQEVAPAPAPVAAPAAAGALSRPRRGPAGVADTRLHFHGHAPEAPAAAGKLSDIIAQAKALEERRFREREAAADRAES